MNNQYKSFMGFEGLNDLPISNRQTSNNINLLSSVPVLDRPVLRLFDQGEFVSLLQAMLKHLMFYNGDITGNFDNNTSLSVKAFQTNNKLSPDGIVGRDTWSALIYLYSPLAVCEEGTYIVQRGDTLYSIARRYNTTVQELIRLNNLETNILNVGQELIIPGAIESPPSTNVIVYTVQSGDNLYSIARRYNTTVQELIRLNNLKSNILSIGQQLIIPGELESSPSTNVIVYTVQSGDNLYSIARRYNTTVQELIRLNNLKSNLLSIGQQLTIQM